MADMANTYKIVEEMRMIPFNAITLTTAVIAAVVPIIPLVLTRVPLPELAKVAVKILGPF
jgi:hypothetical protein